MCAVLKRDWSTDPTVSCPSLPGLSKWVRKHINHDYQFRDALVKLKDFMFSRSQAGSPSVGEASVAK